MLVDQDIFNSNGTQTAVTTQSQMYFAGDGHTHWHIRDLATYELQNSNATIKRTSEKHGFCAFDNDDFNLALPDAPQTAQYAPGGCGNASDTTVTTGISVGWADVYREDTTGPVHRHHRLAIGRVHPDLHGRRPGLLPRAMRGQQHQHHGPIHHGQQRQRGHRGLCVVGLHHHADADADADAHPDAGSPFTDIAASPFKSEIQWAYQTGITAGCTPTKFCPLATVTREQMASFLVRGLDLPPTGERLLY